MKNILVLILVLLTESYGTASAQKALSLNDESGWQKIGEKTVDFRQDQNEIPVLGANRFGMVKFKVQGVAVTILDVSLEYESGDYQMVSLGTTIPAGMESRDIRLNGEERDLKRIVFVCKTIPNYLGEKATVEVWGNKTTADQSSHTGR